MKSERKQIVTGSDVLYVFFSAALMFTFVASAVSDTVNSDQVEQAKLDVENLVLQIQSSGLKKLLPQVSNDRSLASVKDLSKVSFQSKIGDEGELGKDPWGKPYLYKLIKDDRGNVVKLLVVSGGPDLEVSTPLDPRILRETQHVRFVGDDIGRTHDLQ